MRSARFSCFGDLLWEGRGEKTPVSQALHPLGPDDLSAEQKERGMEMRKRDVEMNPQEPEENQPDSQRKEASPDSNQGAKGAPPQKGSVTGSTSGSQACLFQRGVSFIDDLYPFSVSRRTWKLI